MVRVSAIIPVYNGAPTVDRAIESTLSQQFEGLEVVVVDDGSTDATRDVVKKWGASLTFVRQTNRGPSAARNAGVRAGSGEYIAFLDADDVWLPGKLTRMVGALDANRDAVLAYSDFIAVDDSGREVRDSLLFADRAHAPSMDELLAGWWPILTSTVVMRRDAFVRCGGFSEEFRSAGYEDPFLWLLAREQGKFIYVAEPLVRYRAETALQRMRRYSRGGRIFAGLVRARYGRAGRRLAEEVVRAETAAIGHEGLLAMRRGDRAQARRAFLLALRCDPRHLRNGLRLLRTFLPPTLARALTGRTRNEVG
jgi:glycosyltransferase involved in cell wall biosynthesis